MSNFDFNTIDRRTLVHRLAQIPHWIIPSGQNGCHFADDSFMRIFMNEKFCISILISLRLVPKGPIGNKSALVQVMVMRQAIILTNSSRVHRRTYAALGQIT